MLLVIGPVISVDYFSQLASSKTVNLMTIVAIPGEGMILCVCQTYSFQPINILS